MIDPTLARRIRLVGLDVDGVMTDGGIYLGATAGSSLEFKRYDIQDGLGILFLRNAGIIVTIVTGRVSESVRLRAAELGITEVAQDAQARKFPAFVAMLRRHDVKAEEAAFIGDDFPDLAILRHVGLAVAVDNAVDEIKAVCPLHLRRRGGHGAVREFAELLLRARGDWQQMVDRYVAERSVAAAEVVG